MIEIIFSAILSLASLQSVTIDDLPPKYSSWLKMDVVYIISEREKEIFLKLENDYQRDRFIKEFWEQRDPTPGTEENEFRDEHYRRIDYANKWLGRETFKKGWQTDQGRIYIQLGEPKDIRRYHTDRILVPQELWFYQCDPNLGVPPHFYVIFFKKHGVGELIQYDPTLHNSGSLIYLSAGENFEVAGQKIAEVDHELALAAVSLVPSEPGDIDDPRPTLSSVSLMAQLENFANFERDATYAERILRGEASVETNFTFVSEPPENTFNVFKLATGDSIVNYSFHFSPQKLQYGKYNDKVYTSLEVLITVKDVQEKIVLSRSQPLDLTFSDKQIDQLQNEGVSFEDHFILLPGKYKANLTIRNRITKLYYTVSKDLEVPDFVSKETTILDPVLFLRADKGQQINSDAIPPYAWSTVKIYPLLPAYVPTGNDLQLFYQVTSPEIKSALKISYQVFRKLASGKGDPTVVFENEGEIPIGQFNQNGTASIFAAIPSKSFTPGDYLLRISAKDGEKLLSSNSAAFTVSPMVKGIEPVIFYGKKINFSSPDPLLEKTALLINMGRSDVAETLLQKAVQTWPGNRKIAKEMADIYANNNKTDEAIRILTVSSLKYPDEAEWKKKLGLLYLRTGKHNKCIAYLEQTRQQEGDTEEVLNLLGEAYRYIGNNDKALEMWNSSLAIRPGQSIIEERIKSLTSEK